MRVHNTLVCSRVNDSTRIPNAMFNSKFAIFAHGCYVTSMSLEGNRMALDHSLTRSLTHSLTQFFKVIKSMYSSIKSCVKTDESSITEMFSCKKGIRQGDGLSPVLFSLFMNDLPQYFRDDHCPGVMLGSHSLNCLMYADDLLVLSPSPEGLQKSINVVKKHAEEWTAQGEYQKIKYHHL